MVEPKERYKIIESSIKWRFEEEVNKAMNDGWEPLGGVRVRGTGYDIYYCQAMIFKPR